MYTPVNYVLMCASVVVIGGFLLGLVLLYFCEIARGRQKQEQHLHEVLMRRRLAISGQSGLPSRVNSAVTCQMHAGVDLADFPASVHINSHYLTACLVGGEVKIHRDADGSEMAAPETLGELLPFNARATYAQEAGSPASLRSGKRRSVTAADRGVPEELQGSADAAQQQRRLPPLTGSGVLGDLGWRARHSASSVAPLFPGDNARRIASLSHPVVTLQRDESKSPMEARQQPGQNGQTGGSQAARTVGRSHARSLPSRTTTMTVDITPPKML